MLRFNKATYLSLFKVYLIYKTELFFEIINHNFVEFITLLHTFLVISFARYKKYMFCLISFSKTKMCCLLLLVQLLLLIFEAFA